MDIQTLLKQSTPFLEAIVDWRDGLPELDLAAELTDPHRAAVLVVDLINGFCTTGPLSSPRVQSVVAPSARLLERAHALGVQHFLLPQDTHEPDAVEFGSFAPHCVRDTIESQTVPELASLPFADQFILFPKNSINPALAPNLREWLDGHTDVDTFIVVGDCTDFCIYQMALALRVGANDRQQRGVRVIVPADCVNTFDLPVDTADSLGILPHAGDLMHLLFLYHMAVNGVEIVAGVR